MDNKPKSKSITSKIIINTEKVWCVCNVLYYRWYQKSDAFKKIWCIYTSYCWCLILYKRINLILHKRIKWVLSTKQCYYRCLCWRPMRRFSGRLSYTIQREIAKGLKKPSSKTPPGDTSVLLLEIVRDIWRRQSVDIDRKGRVK